MTRWNPASWRLDQRVKFSGRYRGLGSDALLPVSAAKWMALVGLASVQRRRRPRRVDKLNSRARLRSSAHTAQLTDTENGTKPALKRTKMYVLLKMADLHKTRALVAYSAEWAKYLRTYGVIKSDGHADATSTAITNRLAGWLRAAVGDIVDQSRGPVSR